jgi:hypothetical protein
MYYFITINGSIILLLCKHGTSVLRQEENVQFPSIHAVISKYRRRVNKYEISRSRNNIFSVWC